MGFSFLVKVCSREALVVKYRRWSERLFIEQSAKEIELWLLREHGSGILRSPQRGLMPRVNIESMIASRYTVEEVLKAILDNDSQTADRATKKARTSTATSESQC